MKLNVLRAIFVRNFISYFTNPTGYVFICVFVLLSSFAAFWPNEFFSRNLANLDQLNLYLPYILLVFVPAITMSIWADERRQGTDELLLTIPANDFEVVLGKYLAAVAIYSVSLLFSFACNYAVVARLGDPDMGLFIGTYVGYWLVGLAMLGVGMVASFLTGNLTVGFVLGLMFNAPLAFAASAEVILPAKLAQTVEQWSLDARFRDFGHGVINLSGLAYFGMIVAIGLYLSMVLIGRRHWLSGRVGRSLAGHYALRTVSLVVITAGLALVFQRHDVRFDVTSERLSSISPATREIIRNLNPEQPVRIEAFISPEVPELYVQTRLNLLSSLREMEAMGGGNILVNLHDTEPLSDDADRAEQQYDITSRQVLSRMRGAMSVEDIYMGLAVESGLEKVVLPFVDRGIPVEYELVRSIATVSHAERKKLGVISTDANMFGGFDMQSMSSRPDEPLITELRKQYEVEQVSLDSDVKPGDYDVLLAVQPSSLGPEQMNRFIAAVRAGVPTAIFEDPFPANGTVPGTSAPRNPPQQDMMFGGQQPPPPKGNIAPLWQLLGVSFGADKIIWQDYVPIKQVTQWEKEIVFVDEEAGEGSEFNEQNNIISGLQQLVFLFPGAFSRLNNSDMEFETLVQTGPRTGTVDFSDLLRPSFLGQPGGLNPARRHVPTRINYVLSAQIHGKPKSDPLLQGLEPEKEGDAGDDADEPEVNVVLTSDMDLLSSVFFQLRSEGQSPEREVNFDFDNVTFVLNQLDVLAGDERFVDIRKRRPTHRTLAKVEARTSEYVDRAMKQREQFMAQFEEERDSAQEEMNTKIEKLQNRKDLNQLQLLQQLAMVQNQEQRKFDVKVRQLERLRDREVGRINRELNSEIRSVQNYYKQMAVFLPPIPPLLVGLLVFFNRRAHEREGVSRERLR